MDRLPPFDELSNLRSELESDFAAGMEQRKRNRDGRIDEILDMLIVAYMFGNEAGNEMLYGPTELSNGEVKRTIDIDLDEMDDAIFRQIAGKDWQERVTEYLDDLQGTVDDIIRVVDTDINRIYNDAVLDVGERSDGTVMKTWQTMEDEKVREGHMVLDGVTIPVDSRFWTIGGDSARYPGDFTSPELNINCRCRLYLSKA